MRSPAVPLLAVALAATPALAAPPPPASPTEKSPMKLADTRRVDAADTLHGTRVPDPYRWLEDASQPEVKEWMHAHDADARARLSSLPAHAQLVARLRELYYLESVTSPVRRGDHLFYGRTHKDREKAIIYFRPAADGGPAGERVLLDPNGWSKDGSVSLGVCVVSHDGARAAYGVKANNSDEAVLHVVDVASAKVSDVDVIPGAKYAHPSWTPDGSGFYYTWVPPVGDTRDGRPVTVADRPGFAEVRFHRLGEDPAKDRLVRAASHDPQTFVSADLSRDGRWLLLYVSHGWNATDVYYRDLADATWTDFRPFVVGVDAQYAVEAWQGTFYVRTNEGAPRWKLMAVAATSPHVTDRATWRTLIHESPAAENAVLEEAHLAGGRLVTVTLRDVVSRLEVRDLDGALLHDVPLPAPGTVSGVTAEPDQEDVYFGFSSFTVKPSVWRLSVDARAGTARTSRAPVEWAHVEVPVDTAPYVAEQLFYRGKDGARIPLFLVHKRGAARDGKTPVLLYGYGGFNVMMRPSFSSGIYPWLEAGGAYAVAILRGGGEYGEAWHRAGMLERKQTVFDDFLAAAQFLVDEKWTSPAHLAIRGGSNGGLLVGAAMTQRPDLFRAVVCQVPLLDMVRYHLFGSGKTWIPEYGSADDAAQFRAIHAYSPYARAVEGGPRAYPALLMMSADSDDRVDPLHARKFVAAVAHASTSGRPVLLRIEAHAGHGGADLVEKAVEQSADAWAFVMSELGGAPAHGGPR